MVAEIRGLPLAEARVRIEETVAEVKMSEWFDKKVGKFSEGMKQRINVVAASRTQRSSCLTSLQRDLTREGRRRSETLLVSVLCSRAPNVNPSDGNPLLLRI